MALANKLTLLNAHDGTRILPAYLSDNYVSLLPGETTEIQIEYPASAAGPAQFGDSGLESCYAYRSHQRPTIMQAGL